MRRPWDLAIELDRDATLPPFLQIARALAADIRRGRLRPGDRLPGSRRIAASAHVHRNTVLAAMAELMAEGWIETAPGRGTFVTRTMPDDRGRPFSRRLGVRVAVPARAGFAKDGTRSVPTTLALLRYSLFTPMPRRESTCWSEILRERLSR